MPSIMLSRAEKAAAEVTSNAFVAHKGLLRPVYQRLVIGRLPDPHINGREFYEFTGNNDAFNTEHLPSLPFLFASQRLLGSAESVRLTKALDRLQTSFDDEIIVFQLGRLPQDKLEDFARRYHVSHQLVHIDEHTAWTLGLHVEPAKYPNQKPAANRRMWNEFSLATALTVVNAPENGRRTVRHHQLPEDQGRRGRRALNMLAVEQELRLITRR